MIKNIKSVGVLVAICTVVALLLALTNQITAPIIEKNEQIKAAKALREVMPKGELFEQIDLDKYKGKMPASVIEVHEETKGIGYVIKLNVKGFKPDMMIMCGVTTDGKITGATCVSSNETNGAEKAYGKKFVGKDATGVNAVETVSGSTMTTTAYKQAMKDALTAVLVLGGAEVDLRTDEEKAVDKMIEELGATKAADLSQYQLPATVTKALQGDKGAVIYLTIDAYEPDMEIVCGVTPDGKVVKAICLKSNETKAAEKTYGENFTGKDLAGVDAVDTIGGITMTTAAYKKAVKDAINTTLILGGADIDARDPAQILADNLAATLPAGEGKFTKLFFTEKVEGVDAIYAADNGAGYVAVIGEEFVATDAEGNSDNAVAAAAVKVIRNSSSEDILAAFQEKMNGIIAITTEELQQGEYTSIKNNVLALNKTASGNYDITINGLGFGYYGDKANYQPAKNIPIVIRVSITPDGKIIDTLTVSHSESNGWGAVCGDESYYSQFDGKTAESYKEVDAISGATKTTDGYMKAIARCFTIVDILEGGAE